MIEYLVWVKKNRTEKGYHDSSGYYFQHAKEICLVARTSGWRKVPYRRLAVQDVMEAVIKEQSQKPEEIYRLIEQFAPNQKYLELVGRNHDARKGWTTIGDEMNAVNTANQ